MLRILYGTAGTGKSAAIMDEIRRGADSGERYILLVPEQYSHEAERELCAVCGDGLSLYAEVLSFTGLAREISSECGGAANEYLDKGGRLLCMALAADGLYSRLRVYGAARRKAELQTMLLGAVDEFKSACVTGESSLCRLPKPARVRWATSCTTWGLYSRRMTALSQTEGQTRPTG